MLARFRRLAATVIRGPERLEVLEHRFDELDGRRRQTRKHTEAAVAAAHASAVAAAREHAEAAASAALEAAIAASREHAEAAIAASYEHAVAAARVHAEAAVTAALADSRAHSDRSTDAVLEAARQDTATSAAELRRELRTLERLADRTRPSPTEAGTHSPTTRVADAIDPAFYVALEDRFRGSEEEIATRQRAYLELVADLVDDAHPVVDLGCGRGEWLRVLTEAGVAAIGVDNNAAFVAEAEERGHTIVESDLLSYLESRESGSVGAVTLFQVVEHLELAVLLRVLEEAARVLRRGGLLLAETPNALNLQVAAANFWIDPTHVRPLHPEFLRFCAMRSGFSRTEGRFSNDLDSGYRTIEDPVLRRLVEYVDGPGDFTLVAWT